ncbi:MAG: hypothetical protein GW839_11390 [Flavobacteriales bacterium]|nr:hypothetical protein [Flavobacteriia bacterium]NCP05733.1 hypothetical protein [Flavobacteriales bacterium]PIV94542.1 MAG: hypothetical protein COW44_03780 [Flavobacteriaceae bacterium CG17_big_fil_post_rev_8_21_14_2_50_33_15]PIY10685.1 MAG: hypothetical protein COZ17_09190 [Flavobacteriaceae bacterium CG_4_10_14_3_um_filter_33_47]PJB18152.1 MAG: hypothetical protein CO117_09170 [Flavobacteriaceae bacterium CG_4_9_14_3_um_filter_33_16]
MRKKAFHLIVVLLLSLFTSTAMATGKNLVAKDKPNTEILAEIKTLLNRIDEIKAIDKSTLKSSERKELRKEVREIKKEIKAKGGGLYLSAGAIIIILLVLLIL